MRVKSHQLPMTMRRATDPRMESLPVEGWGGDIQKEDVSAGTAQNLVKQKRNPNAVDFR